MKCRDVVVKHKAELILGPLFKVLEVIFELLTPFLVRDIINNGFVFDINNLVIGGNNEYIFIRGAVIFSFAILGFCSTMVCQFLGCRAGCKVEEQIKNKIVEHYLSLAKKEVDNYGKGNIITLLSTDSTNVGHATLLAVRLLIRSPILIIGSLICALIINPFVGLIFIGVAVIVTLVLFFVIKYSSKKYIEIQKNLDEISSITGDAIEGSRTIRAFNTKEKEIEEFDKSISKYKDKNIKLGLVNAISNPMIFLAVNIGILLIIYYGGQYVNLGIFKSGDVVALVNYLNQMLLALVVTSDLVVVFTKGFASSKRINDYFAVSNSIESGDSTTSSDEEVIFKMDNVFYSYHQNNHYALRAVSLTIKKGETIGIIGGTGSGKSTLLNLMSRVSDPTKGIVYFKGKDIKNYELSKIHQDISFITQKNAIFKGTIRSNIVLNECFSEEEIDCAIVDSLVSTFVNKYEDGIEHLVEEGGKNLSGGERQRLLLARALIRNKKILLLDDSLSALDNITERTILNNIKNKYKDITIIIVGEKLSSIRNADTIYIFDKGKLVDSGTSDTLISTSSIYKNMHNIEAEGI
ncbi:MAG: ABC transporter ATP-binding protein [Bacilli bacterium]